MARAVRLSARALNEHDERGLKGPRAGRPRFDPVERHLHLFYEPLIILSILDPTRGVQDTSSETDSDKGPQTGSWPDFLNQLSWLCDSDTGGATCSSIAVQSTTEDHVYWLASNSNPRRKALPHLKWVLECLACLIYIPTQEVQAIETNILETAIDFSSKKVKNYSRKLCVALDCIRAQENPPIAPNGQFAAALKHFRMSTSVTLLQLTSSSEVLLLKRLNLLQDLWDQHYHLCETARKMRNVVSLREICQKRPTIGSRPGWSDVRHYIGRLGSWSKAVASLVSFVRTNPEVIKKFRVDYVPTPGPIAPPLPDHKTNLRSVLERMLPESDESRVRALLEAIKSSRVYFERDFEKIFVQEYACGEFELRPHAEMLMLEHFHSQDLQFYHGDRYVGSSKPSCYCCNLYFTFHSSKIVTRPSHGNLWPKWCLPMTVMQANGRLSFHTKKFVLPRMIHHVQQDALEQIESKLAPRSRVPDSTTGISTTIALSVLTIELPQESEMRSYVEGHRYEAECYDSDGSGKEDSILFKGRRALPCATENNSTDDARLSE